MPESPRGYFPDVRVKFSPSLANQFATEVSVDPHSGVEQRRARSVSTGQRVWRAESVPQEQAIRRSLSTFLNSLRGQLYSCYFFAPDPSYVVNASLGTVTASSTFVIPWKALDVDDVRVAGVSQAFTTRSLSPRTDTYAALLFDGSASYVDCGSNASLRPTSAMTLAAWVWTRSTAAAQIILSNENANASGFTLGIDNTGKPFFRTSQAAASQTLASSGTVSTETWTHIAVRFSATTATIYINGVAAGTSAAITAATTATLSFRIGRGGSMANVFNGMIADVRVYNTQQSAGEVTNIYNGVATPTSALKGHWLLDEGYSTSAADSSGTANTGTLTSSPAWVGGETEIVFSGGSQTGAVTGTLTGRQRVIARSLRDSVGQAFVQNVNDVMTSFAIEMLELPS